MFKPRRNSLSSLTATCHLEAENGPTGLILPRLKMPHNAARGCKKNDLGCVAWFRTAEDEVLPSIMLCPHKGGPLAEVSFTAKSVTCPLAQLGDRRWIQAWHKAQMKGPCRDYPARVKNKGGGGGAPPPAPFSLAPPPRLDSAVLPCTGGGMT